jgi:hypothetical protein
MRRSSRFFILFLSSLCPLLLSACASNRADTAGQSHAAAASAEKTLTPQEFLLLSDEEKIRYRNVALRIPEAWGGALLPFTPGPFESILEKGVHSGELAALMAQYNRSLFELEHPRVRVEFINFDMWSPNFKSVLAVSLSAGRAPAVYIARDLPQTIDQGMYADITDLLASWDQADRQPEGSVRQGTVNGRTYTIAGNELGATIIRYRKDWFREAGIFNEHGEPGPPTNWTWADFRRIAKQLTDPAKKRWGYAGQVGDFFYNDAQGIRLYIPDRSGQNTWRFNDADPRLISSLETARQMVRDDKSVVTSVSMGWFEWHSEFDASRAGMISSFSPHIPSASLSTPDKFGADKPFKDTVGMIPPPVGPAGLSGFQAITNNFGFDPTLSPEQLQAAFDWTKSHFYGPLFVNNMRAAIQRDKVLGKPSTAYATLLYTPYEPEEKLLDTPLEKIFPADYLRTYAALRRTHAPPLPREFGLQEPPTNDFNDAVKAMYSEAIMSQEVDLQALVQKTADITNKTMLRFRTPDDRKKLRAYFTALGEFYRTYYPEFYQKRWGTLYERYYRVDGS